MPRPEVVARLTTVFRRHGYDGATLSRLSHATGLGKASLYHHFPGGKEDMAAAVLEGAEAWLQSQLVQPLRGPDTPRQRLEQMVRALDQMHAGGREGCLFAALTLGEARERFHDRLRRAFKAWIGAVAALLAEAGLKSEEAARRAEDAVLRIQGALVLSAGLGSPAPFRRLMQDLPDELLAGASAAARARTPAKRKAPARRR
ncbi:MAG: TetR/AcrR family transcriptional regulator [Rhodospirillaceae bacterium]|nr:TetR/AcrR family transcriptional regulator [Rhodospirillaceae bacterium]